MSQFDEKLTTLQTIITRDSSTSTQRKQAKKMRKKLIQADIDDHFETLETNTAVYNQFIVQLQEIIDAIEGDQVSNALDTLDSFASSVAAAATN